MNEEEAHALQHEHAAPQADGRGGTAAAAAADRDAAAAAADRDAAARRGDRRADRRARTLRKSVVGGVPVTGGRGAASRRLRLVVHLLSSSGSGPASPPAAAGALALVTW